MFISEISECNFYGFGDLDQHTIDESNHGFAEIVSRYINESLDVESNQAQEIIIKFKIMNIYKSSKNLVNQELAG